MILSASLLSLSASHAHPETISRSLEDLGFSGGFQLRFDEAANVFLQVPEGAVLNGIVFETAGVANTPILSNGTLTWSVNDVPIDTMVLQPGQTGEDFERRTARRGDSAAIRREARALNIRYAADLRRPAAECEYDRADANAVSISPDSRILMDLDLSGVDSLQGALDLLPPDTPIILPDRNQLTPAEFAAALRIGLAVQASGRTPRFLRERPTEATSAFRITPGTSGDMIRLEKPAEGRFDIVVPATSDVGTFVRLWLGSPPVLAGATAAVTDEADPAPEAEEPGSYGFRDFRSLPDASEIGRRGEWRLPFALTAADGGIPDGLQLGIYAAPDWSEERPILTVFLNGQIIGAERLATDKANRFTIDFPATLLRQDNTLRVVVDRSPQGTRCQPPGDGLFAQILDGTRLRLGRNATTGFGAVARNLDDGSPFRVVLPADAVDQSNAASRLTLLADVLAGLNASGTETLSVDLQAPDASPVSQGDLVVESADPDGLVLDMSRIASETRNVSFPDSGLIAAEVIGGERLRLTIQNPVGEYETSGIRFGTGDQALIGSSGILWQNGARGERAGFSNQVFSILDSVSGLGQRFGLVILVSLLGVGLAVIASRRLIVRRATRKRPIPDAD